MDHANAVSVAKELAANEKKVKVTVVEKRQNYDYDRRTGNRYLKDDGYVELGIEYHNLEDFREIIRNEEHDKVHNQFLEFTRKISKLEDQLVSKEDVNAKMVIEISNLKKVNGLCFTENETLKKDVETLTTKNTYLESDVKKQTGISEGINERLKLALKEIHYWKNRNSFWGWLWK